MSIKKYHLYKSFVVFHYISAIVVYLVPNDANIYNFKKKQ